jgi:hypothetical protein
MSSASFVSVDYLADTLAGHIENRSDGLLLCPRFRRGYNGPIPCRHKILARPVSLERLIRHPHGFQRCHDGRIGNGPRH